MRRHHRIATWSAGLSGLVTGLALVGPYTLPEAAANDDKVFAPQFCVPVDALGFLQTEPRILTSSMGPLTEEPVDYLCPLARDSLKGGLAKVWVRLFNSDENTPGEGTQCCIYSADPLTQHSDFACEVADPGKREQSLELTGVTSWDNGHYALRCTLESGDLIYSYRSSET